MALTLDNRPCRRPGVGIISATAHTADCVIGMEFIRKGGMSLGLGLFLGHDGMENDTREKYPAIRRRKRGNVAETVKSSNASLCPFAALISADEHRPGQHRSTMSGKEHHNATTYE